MWCSVKVNIKPCVEKDVAQVMLFVKMCGKKIIVLNRRLGMVLPAYIRKECVLWKVCCILIMLCGALCGGPRGGRRRK